MLSALMVALISTGGPALITEDTTNEDGVIVRLSSSSAGLVISLVVGSGDSRLSTVVEYSTFC